MTKCTKAVTKQKKKLCLTLSLPEFFPDPNNKICIHLKVFPFFIFKAVQQELYKTQTWNLTDNS